MAVLHSTTNLLSNAGPAGADITQEDYEPWFGVVTLSQQNIEERQTIGNYWSIHIKAHELGHIIGITGHEGGWDVPSLERYIDRQNHTFEGPKARSANGENAVPFQWLAADGTTEVPPRTPGATVDHGHLGVCSSLLAYCTDPRNVFQSSEIDFAFLDDIGYEILDANTAAGLEVYGYGAWGRYSVWGAGVERDLGYEDNGSDVTERDRLRAGADAFGIAPGMSLAELRSSSTLGRVTWNGSLIGIDLGSAKLPPVFGDAQLGVDLDTLAGTANFDNLAVHADGEASPFRAPHLEYPIEVTGNSFSDSESRVAGSFFGPAHEEMAGVINDRAPAVNLLAGFGGTR